MCEPSVISRENLERWWLKIERRHGFYKAADGESLESFKAGLSHAALVYEWPFGLIWFGLTSKGWLLHPVLWGCSYLRGLRDGEAAIQDAKQRLHFKQLLVRFPWGSKSLRRLASRFGFRPTGVYEWGSFPSIEAPFEIWVRED